MNALVADVLVSDPVEQRLLDRVPEVRKIFFRNLLVDVQMGVHDHEKDRTQPISINIVLYLRTENGPEADSLSEVFDYDQIREGVLELARSRHINLQETLVEEIADFALAFDDVLAIRASTEKTDVYPDCQGVGFELIRIAPE